MLSSTTLSAQLRREVQYRYLLPSRGLSLLSGASVIVVQIKRYKYADATMR